MVDREVVLSRLNHLEENLNYLKGLKKFTQNEFCSEQDIYFRYERALHLALEAVIDLGNHLIADQKLRTPESNRDIFKILGENKIIGQSLSDNLIKMAGFRNILVHDYLKLNRELEYNIILDNISDIEAFMRVVVEYI